MAADVTFLDGKGLAEAIKPRATALVLAALNRFMPGISPTMPGELPRFRLALQGWCRPAPMNRSSPCPWLV